jgi:hypothetical protein
MIASFEHGDLGSSFGGGDRRGQPGQSGADHDDVVVVLLLHDGLLRRPDAPQTTQVGEV